MLYSLYRAVICFIYIVRYARGARKVSSRLDGCSYGFEGLGNCPNFRKSEKNEKIEILKNCIKFYGKFAIKSIVFEPKCIAVTRRAGCSILGSKSNTVLGEKRSQTPCNILIFFLHKCQKLTLLHLFDFGFYFISVEISLRAFE